MVDVAGTPSTAASKASEALGRHEVVLRIHEVRRLALELPTSNTIDLLVHFGLTELALEQRTLKPLASVRGLMLAAGVGNGTPRAALNRLAKAGWTLHHPSRSSKSPDRWELLSPKVPIGLERYTWSHRDCCVQPLPNHDAFAEGALSGLGFRLLCLLGHPPVSTAELALRTGRHRSRVSEVMTRLVTCELAREWPQRGLYVVLHSGSLDAAAEHYGSAGRMAALRAQVEQEHRDYADFIAAIDGNSRQVVPA